MLKKFISYIVRKKFPIFHRVEVTKERNFSRSYIEKERNNTYNIFLITTPAERTHLERETVNDVKKIIYENVKLVGIDYLDTNIYIEVDY